MENNASSITGIADRYGVVTYKPLLSLEQAKETGQPIEWSLGGKPVVVCYRIEDTFSVVKLTLHKSEFGPTRKSLYKNAFALLYLNPEVSFDKLCSFYYEVVSHCTLSEVLRPEKSLITNVMSFCADKEVDVDKLQIPAVFYWKTHLPIEDKRSIVAKSINESISMKNFKSVKEAIEEEMEFGDRFITNQLIADKTGLGSRTARRYAQSDKELIDEYNRTVFGTHEFSLYIKTMSVHKITKSIRVLNKMQKKISKANVSRDTGLHYNSILNLWEEEEVQEELDKYNKVVGDLVE